jgi:hypothetical protein
VQLLPTIAVISEVGWRGAQNPYFSFLRLKAKIKPGAPISVHDFANTKA